jgi:hypothetical protein
LSLGHEFQGSSTNIQLLLQTPLRIPRIARHCPRQTRPCQGTALCLKFDEFTRMDHVEV